MSEEKETPQDEIAEGVPDEQVPRSFVTVMFAGHGRDPIQVQQQNCTAYQIAAAAVTLDVYARRRIEIDQRSQMQQAAKKRVGVAEATKRVFRKKKRDTDD